VLGGAPPGNAAARPGRVLRVCADPANLPFSNDHEAGFENQIATLLARELHAELSYTWWAQRRGFFRSTLNAGNCDVVLGVPIGLSMVRTTQPYYRSSFAFVSRSERKLSDLRSLDDARLRSLKIAVALAGDDGANPAPVHALARRGIVSNLVGFSLWDEYQRPVPAAVEAVVNRSVDVALLWGPVAGGGAKRSGAALTVRPVLENSDGEQPFAFSIGMGVRKQDEALARELDAFIVHKKAALTEILRAAGVPLLPIPAAKPRVEADDD
jgi:quinoprotein dehydrogenase-associated probable ABC transporter substrate-binding protein